MKAGKSRNEENAERAVKQQSAGSTIQKQAVPQETTAEEKNKKKGREECQLFHEYCLT